MSHKTLLKRYWDEASTSTAVHHGELEKKKHKPTPIEIAEPDEPEPSTSQRDITFTDDVDILKKKYAMLIANLERKQREHVWNKQCLNCVKRHDDVVRKVHTDLLNGRITMVGVTLTNKPPIKTRNRRVQTSPERMETSPERVQTRSVQVQTSLKREQTSPERVQTNLKQSRTGPDSVKATLKRLLFSTEVHINPKRVHAIPERVLTSPERLNTNPKRVLTSPERLNTNPKRVLTSPERFNTNPKRVLTSPERLNTNSKRVLTSPERLNTNSKRVLTSPERFNTNSKRVLTSPERFNTNSKRVLTSPERFNTNPKRVRTSPERVEHDMEREDSLTRDFCGGTVPSVMEGGCQCNYCVNYYAAAAANYFATRPNPLDTRPIPRLSRIHRNRAHSVCEDGALTDLHQHVLAGDKKTPGSLYVDILAGLHAQGPCQKPCKLRADVVWMYDHIPTQAETQTDLTGDAGVREQGTQTNLARSVGIQNGGTLARVIAAQFTSASIQINLPAVPTTHRPVGRVLPTVIPTTIYID